MPGRGTCVSKGVVVTACLECSEHSAQEKENLLKKEPLNLIRDCPQQFHAKKNQAVFPYFFTSWSLEHLFLKCTSNKRKVTGRNYPSESYILSNSVLEFEFLALSSELLSTITDRDLNSPEQ